MTKRLSMIGLSIALSLSGCASSGGNLPTLARQEPSPYRLGPGDELRVNVFGLDALNNTYLVTDTGAISMPLIEPVDVSGRTVHEVELAIVSAIRARQIVLDPKVAVQVQTYRPFFILGEVQKPGQYPYVPGMSVTTAVSVAGGYTFRANTKTAMITRASHQARAGAEDHVLPGDMIRIPESWF
jgi:protein involved in polysaccharide export with SLBB domain